MRSARWTAPLVGFALAAALVTPAAARGHAAGATNQDILSAGLMSSTDVPQGWTPSKQNDSTKPFTGISACKQILAASSAARKSVPRKLSPTLTDPTSQNLTTAADTVYAFKDVAAASKFLATYQGSATGNCLVAVVKKSFGRNLVSDQVATISNLQGVGDAAAGYEATVRAKDPSGSQVTAVLDILAVRVGRAFVGFDFTGQNQQIPTGPQIVTTIVNRLRAANA